MNTLVTRSVALDDIHVRAGGTGRDVVAYAAVWMSPTEIMDEDGHYQEQHAPDSMTKSIQGRAGRIFSVYNHGKTLHGTPSEVYSVPLGKPLEIRPDNKGLLTVTRYNKDPEAERILEAIRSGSLTGMSFTGVFLSSDPQRSRFERYAPTYDGVLPMVTRMETTLIEYGPTPNPAFHDAEIVGVRNKPQRESITVRDGSASVRGVETLHPGDAERLHEYWVRGEGAAKIRWGEPGDFQRCVDHLEKYMPGRAEGYCNLAHHSALGVYPATHAKMEGRSMSDPLTGSADMADNADRQMSDNEAEQQLTDLLGDLSDEEINELATLAEAMHSEVGD